MSRHIVRTKNENYRLLQVTRDEDRWEDWVLYMLTAVEETARKGITAVGAIRTAFFDYKHRIRANYTFYSEDLINNLFSHPYTRIQFVESELYSILTARQCSRRRFPRPDHNDCKEEGVDTPGHKTKGRVLAAAKTRPR